MVAVVVTLILLVSLVAFLLKAATVFNKAAVIKNFAKFPENHLQWSLSVVGENLQLYKKIDFISGVFSVKFPIFFIEHLRKVANVQ